MDGLPPGVGSRSAHSSHHDLSHSRHRSYMPNDATSLLSSSMPFMMPSYPMMVMPGGTQPSCAEAGVLSPTYRQGVDLGRAPPSYGAEHAYKSSSFTASSSARHSPSRTSVTTSLPSSSDHRSAASVQQRGSTGTYSAPAPASQPSGRLAPPADVSYQQYQEQPTQKQSGAPEPPKKPLSPYMRFSKSIWFQVKAANPQLSVCQLGAMIGRMWRELSEEDKRRHLEDFRQDKLRYDSELKRYLKSTGLRAKDLKAIAKTQPKSKSRHSERSSSSQQPGAVATTTNANTQLAAQAAFMGLPLASMPMAVGMPAGMLGHAGAMSMLPHFSQVWTGQQYAGQPASAAMMGIAGHLAQGLYSNGYMAAAADGSVVGAPAPSGGSSLSASKQAMLSHEMYRYSQNYH